LANVEVGERYASEQHFQEGYRLLAKIFSRHEQDPDVLDAMARVLMLKDRPREASGLLRRAVRSRPGYAPLYVNLAGALRAAGDNVPAREALEIALELDPLLESAYQALATLAAFEGGRVAERLVWRRYLEWAPNNLRARKGAE